MLVDTYDSVAAIELIVGAGFRPAAVRLDSGDLAGLSQVVRARLDAGGLTETKILVSGDLDEHRIAELISSGAPIDGFGVGTALSTVADASSIMSQECMRSGAISGKQHLPAYRDHSTIREPDRWQVLTTIDLVLVPGHDSSLVIELAHPPRMPLPDRLVAQDGVELG